MPAGYILATQEFPGRRVILLVTFVAMVTPNAAIVLPIFLEMSLLGLNNTRFSLVLAPAFLPFGDYIAFICFTTSLPREIDRTPSQARWNVLGR